MRFNIKAVVCTAIITAVTTLFVTSGLDSVFDAIYKPYAKVKDIDNNTAKIDAVKKSIRVLDSVNYYQDKEIICYLNEIKQAQDGNTANIHYLAGLIKSIGGNIELLTDIAFVQKAKDTIQPATNFVFENN